MTEARTTDVTTWSQHDDADLKWISMTKDNAVRAERFAVAAVLRGVEMLLQRQVSCLNIQVVEAAQEQQVTP